MRKKRLEGWLSAAPASICARIETVTLGKSCKRYAHWDPGPAGGAHISVPAGQGAGHPQRLAARGTHTGYPHRNDSREASGTCERAAHELHAACQPRCLCPLATASVTIKMQHMLPHLVLTASIAAEQLLHAALRYRRQWVDRLPRIPAHCNADVHPAEGTQCAFQSTGDHHRSKQLPYIMHTVTGSHAI